MAVDMFMKLEEEKGKYLKGESADAKHPDEIDILSWSWGMTQSGTTHMGSGGGAGKVSVNDLSFTKFTDKGTPNLQLACCDGKHFSQATLTVRKAGEKPLEYLKITMKEVIISSLSFGGSRGDDRLTENVTLNFAEFKTEYTPQKPDGTGAPAIEIGWDIAKNVKV